jgi:hypothetical protein
VPAVFILASGTFADTGEAEFGTAIHGPLFGGPQNFIAGTPWVRVEELSHMTNSSSLSTNHGPERIEF